MGGQAALDRSASRRHPRWPRRRGALPPSAAGGVPVPQSGRQALADLEVDTLTIGAPNLGGATDHAPRRIYLELAEIAGADEGRHFVRGLDAHRPGTGADRTPGEEHVLVEPHAN